MKFDSETAEKMSLYELKDWCEHKEYSVVYRSRMQDYHNPVGTIRIEAVFDKMLIFFNPNSIVLKSDTACVRFECIKNIEIISTEGKECEFAIKINCKNCEREVSHFLLLSKVCD